MGLVLGALCGLGAALAGSRSVAAASAGLVLGVAVVGASVARGVRVRRRSHRIVTPGQEPLVGPPLHPPTRRPVVTRASRTWPDADATASIRVPVVLGHLGPVDPTPTFDELVTGDRPRLELPVAVIGDAAAGIAVVGDGAAARAVHRALVEDLAGRADLDRVELRCVGDDRLALCRGASAAPSAGLGAPRASGISAAMFWHSDRSDTAPIAGVVLLPDGAAVPRGIGIRVGFADGACTVVDLGSASGDTPTDPGRCLDPAGAPSTLAEPGTLFIPALPARRAARPLRSSAGAP